MGACRCRFRISLGDERGWSQPAQERAARSQLSAQLPGASVPCRAESSCSGVSSSRRSPRCSDRICLRGDAPRRSRRCPVRRPRPGARRPRRPSARARCRGIRRSQPPRVRLGNHQIDHLREQRSADTVAGRVPRRCRLTSVTRLRRCPVAQNGEADRCPSLLAMK